MAGSSRTRSGTRQRTAVTESVDAFRRILRALRLASRETLSSTGVSAAQLFVLGALEDGEEASMSELAERTMTDRSSVTTVVDRLVDAGLVTRSTSANDRRRAAIGITTKGRTMLRGAPRPPTALLIDGLEALRDSELERLSRGLQALTHSMGIAGDRPEMLFEERAARSGASAPRVARPRRPRA